MLPNWTTEIVKEDSIKNLVKWVEDVRSQQYCTFKRTKDNKEAIDSTVYQVRATNNTSHFFTSVMIALGAHLYLDVSTV